MSVPARVLAVILGLCLGGSLVQCLDCPTNELRQKLMPHVKKSAASKLLGTFSEYYVMSLMVNDHRCGYLQTVKHADKNDYYDVALVIKKNTGDPIRVRLAMKENKEGVLELKELGQVVSKIYPVFVSDNVIGYFMCVPVKALNIGGDSVLWSTVGVRSDQISGSAADIQAAQDAIQALAKELPAEIITLVKRDEVCPQKKSGQTDNKSNPETEDEDAPSVEV